MSVGQRLFWIVAIAIGAAFLAGMYLAGLESLSRLLRGYRNRHSDQTDSHFGAMRRGRNRHAQTND